MKGLLFDFGGTVDTDGVHWMVKFREAYRAAGRTPADAAFEMAYRAAEHHMCSGAVREDDGMLKTLRAQVTLQCAELQKLSRTRGEFTRTLARRISERCCRDVQRTVSALIPLLESWSREYTLGLISNFYGNLPAVCSDLKIARYFAAVVDSAKAGMRKPDPGLFTMALDMMQLRADEVMMVGDSYENDIAPAKKLGCTTAWLYSRPWKEPSEITHADVVIHSLGELNQKFLERTGHENRA